MTNTPDEQVNPELIINSLCAQVADMAGRLAVTQAALAEKTIENQQLKQGYARTMEIAEDLRARLAEQELDDPDHENEAPLPEPGTLDPEEEDAES